MEEYPLLTETNTVIPKGKLRWNCRRGMKELEVLLIPFVDHCYDGLSEEQQSTFARLLGYDDATLFSWFLGSETPEDPLFVNILKEIQHEVGSLLANPGFADSVSL